MSHKQYYQKRKDLLEAAGSFELLLHTANKQVRLLEDRLEIAQTALENIMRHQEKILGVNSVKLSSTWNIAKNALGKIK